MNHNFRSLKIWQIAMDIAEAVYKLSADFPKTEIYGLVSQMRRAAVSVSSNISEGCGRQTNAQFSYFLNIAQGSLFELETQLLLAIRLGFIQIDIQPVFDNIISVQKMNYHLMQNLKTT
jgi:four helix bundle protein